MRSSLSDLSVALSGILGQRATRRHLSQRTASGGISGPPRHVSTSRGPRSDGDVSKTMLPKVTPPSRINDRVAASAPEVAYGVLEAPRERLHPLLRHRLVAVGLGQVRAAHHHERAVPL